MVLLILDFIVKYKLITNKIILRVNEQKIHFLKISKSDNNINWVFYKISSNIKCKALYCVRTILLETGKLLRLLIQHELIKPTQV